MFGRLTAFFATRPRTAEDWLARMGRPNADRREQAAFLAWLEADPDHLRQYEQAKADMASLERLRGAFARDVARLNRREPALRPSGRRLVLAGGMAFAALAVAGVLLAPRPPAAPEGRLYASAPGEITDVVLEDGSRVTLDAGSAIRVALARDARRVTLERGSAYFEVAHDATHPFQVAVADRRVIVTGTRFVTSLTGDGAQVSLLQGRVLIGRRDAAERGALDGATVLSPGERAAFRTDEPGLEKAVADLETATAWRRRRLVFRDAPLSDVVAAAARYSNAPLVAADPRLSRVKVTTVLPLEGEGTIAERMAALLPVRTERAADGRVLVRAD
ncbi:MAG: FecR domain-containing protein [Pseudomonadota bacterium]